MPVPQFQHEILRALLARFDRAFGARPMARLVERVVKKPLSEMLLFGSLTNGGLVRLTLEGDELRLVTDEPR